MSVSAIPVIAIIGGGLSGTLVAAQLLRQARAPLIIKLIERNPRFLHRGIAYSTESEAHLLNVPASNMSAYPDDPEHLLRWGRCHRDKLLDPQWVTEITPDSFISRRGYGEYIRWVFQEAVDASRPDVKLDIIHDEVAGLRPSGEGALLSLQSGNTLHADKLVLAIGHFPPAGPTLSENADSSNCRYISNPWVDASAMAWDEVESCLIVGAGLTMADWVLDLYAKNFRGKIHVVSKRGLLPKAHAKVSAVPLWLNYQQQPLSVRTIFRQFRSLMATPGPTENNWRGLIDALRPYSAEIWSALPLAEQQRFLRHLRPYWDNHRHRLSPITAATLQAIENSGQLVHHTGRVENVELSAGKVDVSIRARGQEMRKILSVDRVINCTGTEGDYRKLQHPLLKDLFSQQLAQPSSIAFGLSVASDGALIGKSGRKSSLIYTLGPPQKGTYWETIAVPEIRGQAERLARYLLAGV